MPASPAEKRPNSVRSSAFNTARPLAPTENVVLALSGYIHVDSRQAALNIERVARRAGATTLSPMARFSTDWWLVGKRHAAVEKVEIRAGIRLHTPRVGDVLKAVARQPGMVGGAFEADAKPCLIDEVERRGSLGHGPAG